MAETFARDTAPMEPGGSASVIAGGGQVVGARQAIVPVAAIRTADWRTEDELVDEPDQKMSSAVDGKAL